VRLVKCSNAAEFVERSRLLLERNEVENTLMLGTSARMARGQAVKIEGAPYFATVKEEGSGDTLAAAMMTPPYKMLVTDSKEEVLMEIVDDAIACDLQVTGVNALSETAATFARLWESRSTWSAKKGRRMRLYQLQAVLPPKKVAGALETAEEKDEELLSRWVLDFHQGLHEPPKHDIDEWVNRMILERQLYVWRTDRGAVSLAGCRDPTSHGIRIGPAYTPPEFRRKGYASACVAELSQQMLNRGYKFCALFTDLSNPTSNHIYQAIGYRPVAEFAEYRFSPQGQC
jgi:predicted GNAT family acetyltransferase